VESTGSKKSYDIGGVHGAEVFRDLPVGVRITMNNGMVGEAIGNPHDGAIMQIRILENPEDPSRVGEEEYVFYTEVREVTDP
jgi:hypothetical protein